MWKVYTLKMTFAGNGTKQEVKYLQIYFDHKANIQIYSNIKNVIIFIL